MDRQLLLGTLTLAHVAESHDVGLAAIEPNSMIQNCPGLATGMRCTTHGQPGRASPAEVKRLAPHQPDLGVALKAAKEGASPAATTWTTLAFRLCSWGSASSLLTDAGAFWLALFLGATELSMHSVSSWHFRFIFFAFLGLLPGSVVIFSSMVFPFLLLTWPGTLLLTVSTAALKLPFSLP